jgi:hypothetical protein
MTPESQNRGARIDVYLLGNDSVNKQVPAAANKQTKIEVFLSYNNGNGVFSWILPEAI